MVSDFFLGFVKIYILHHAAQAPAYGLAFMEDLKRNGYDLCPGTLYPLLRTLEKLVYLVSSQSIIGSKVRKYYAITDAGQGALVEVRFKIRELVEGASYHSHFPHGDIALRLST